jgi:hypothetical protein
MLSSGLFTSVCSLKWSKAENAKRTRMSSGNILKIKRLGIYVFAKLIIMQVL